jgi:hypothetical protein
MKSLNLSMAMLALMLATTNLQAQLKSDIGIRISTSRLEKIQLEFRKPVKEKYSLRFALSTGTNYTLPFFVHKTISNSDTVLVYRDAGSYITRSYNLRAGIQRNLKWNVLSVYSDLSAGYYHQSSRGGILYNVNREDGYSYTTSQPTPHVSQEYYNAQYHDSHWSADYISTGLSLGVSLDVPFYKLILGVNVQANGTMGIPVHHRSVYDPDNDFGDIDVVKFFWHPSAGIALRYMLGKD